MLARETRAQNATRKGRGSPIKSYGFPSDVQRESRCLSSHGTRTERERAREEAFDLNDNNRDRRCSLIFLRRAIFQFEREEGRRRRRRRRE